MNTKPADEILALWVEDELDAATATEVERWAVSRPEWLERRQQARWSRDLLRPALGGTTEVPHPEFFNARIRREIEIATTPAPKIHRGPWRWLMPTTAAAGMALGFLLGEGRNSGSASPRLAAEMTPVLYTPQQGVEAEYLGGDEATVIILAGVQAIPDEWEIPETAMLAPSPSRMVWREEENPELVR